MIEVRAEQEAATADQTAGHILEVEGMAFPLIIHVFPLSQPSAKLPSPTNSFGGVYVSIPTYHLHRYARKVAQYPLSGCEQVQGGKMKNAPGPRT